MTYAHSSLASLLTSHKYLCFSPSTGLAHFKQVIGSANFRTGGDVNDFLHGWLNYQIEHHVWPSLSALSYQRGQPELKAICEKYGEYVRRVRP